MRSILAAALLLVSTSAHAITRAIMEQTAASNNTVFIDTQTIKMGVGTITPRTTFDVEGNAQFGQAPHKSTFSVDGSLHLASGASIVGGSFTARAFGLDVTQSPYSAACDGSTDDSVAIQACLDASAAAGVPCLLPNRTCAFGSAASNPHVYLTFSTGTALSGYENGSSVLLFNTDGGGGVCGQGSGGLIRATSTTGGSADRRLKYVSLEANKLNPGCILNASTTTSGRQVSNTVLEHVSFYDTAGSTGTWGILLGNTVSFRVLKQSYFATSLARDVYSIGRFFNDIHLDSNFFDYLIASSTQNYQVQLSSTNGEIKGWSVSDNVFESGPNSIRVIGAAGGTISNNYFSDVLSQPSTSSWVDVAGFASQVTGNYFNSEGSNTSMTCVKLSGGYGHNVSGNMCDSAMIAFDVEASTGNVVKGNNIYFPSRIGVKVSSGTGNEIGLNAETGNFTTGFRFPIYCDGGAAGNKFYTASTNVNNVNYTDICKASNMVENVADGALQGYGSLALSSSLLIGQSTATTAAFNANGTAILGNSSLAAASGSGGTYQLIDKDTTTERVFVTHNGFAGANSGTKYWGNYVGTLAGMEMFVNSNNNSPFRYAGFGDVGLYNTRGSSFLGSIKLGMLGAFPLTVVDGGVRIGTNAFTSFNQWGGFTMPAGSSATIVSLYVTTASFTGGDNITPSVALSSGGTVAAGGWTAPWFAGTLHGTADAVLAAGIPSSAIDTAKLAPDAVTTAKILTGAVDTSKLATDSVTSVKIQNGAVTNQKTVGTSASCSGSNQYLGGATYVNGLPTGGACQTAGSGSGDAVLNSTQTFSGANTFTSTVTVGPVVYTTTANYQRAVIGSWFVVASTAPDKSAAVSFTNLLATATYRVHWELRNNTSNGTWVCYFNNNNTGTPYKYVVSGMNTSATTLNNTSAGANTFLFNTGTLSDEPNMGWFEYWYLLPSRPDRIIWTGQSTSGDTGTGLVETFFSGGQYTATVANNGRLDCQTTGGTITGKIWIEAMILAGAIP